MISADAAFPFMADLEFHPESPSFRVAMIGSDGTPRLEMATDILTTFIAAVKIGMFSRSARPPFKEDVLLLTSQEAVSTDRVSREYLIQGVDVSALRVLVNLLCQLPSVSGNTFLLLVRSGEGSGGQQYVPEDMASFPYQSWPEVTPFEVICPWSDDITFNPVVRLDFARALTEDEVRILEPAIATWESIVKGGGYMERPVRAEGPFVQGMESYPVSPLRWEVPILRFGAEESSFASLIRFAIRFHYLKCPLISLEIQP